MKNKRTLKLVYAAVCLALAMVLPLLTGQIPEIGSKLSPMHIPALLCGFLCGWEYGLVVGFIAPLLRSLIFGMPPLFPTATAMAFELAAYGAFAGLFYKLFPKKISYIYLTQILAMICGRIVWGAVMFAFMGFGFANFGFEAFLSGAILNAVPGMILHIILVPAIVIVLRQAKLIPDERA